MNFIPPFGHSEGQHINRPPICNVQYYSLWKVIMEDFLQEEYNELRTYVIDGQKIPMIKDVKVKYIANPKDQYDEANYNMVSKNAKAKCIFVWTWT